MDQSGKVSETSQLKRPGANGRKGVGRDVPFLKIQVNTDFSNDKPLVKGGKQTLAG